MNALAVVAALMTVLVGCKGEPVEPPPPHATRAEALEVRLGPAALEAAGLTTGRARSQPRRALVTASGTLEFAPSHVARIGPLIDGRVLTIAVEAGQRVSAGTVLATVASADVGRARADLSQAAVRARAAEAELRRQQTMIDAGVTSGREVVAAETQRSIARMEASAASERLRALGATRTTRGGSSAIPLTSPIEGVVLESQARVGQTVSATDTLFVVGRADTVWLVVDVYERDYARVHQGDAVRVTLVAYPGRTFEGHVDHVGGVLDPSSRAAPVRLTLANPDGALRPGMSATARIVGEPAPSAAPVVTVPRGAVQTIDGQPYVFVERERGRYEVRPIERGPESDGDVEVLRGLRDGEPIVTEGTFLLKSEVLREQMGEND